MHTLLANHVETPAGTQVTTSVMSVLEVHPEKAGLDPEMLDFFPRRAYSRQMAMCPLGFMNSIKPQYPPNTLDSKQGSAESLPHADREGSEFVVSGPVV